LVLASGAGHTAYIDGNGLPNCMGGGAYPGTGLIENPPPTIPGDDLDALDSGFVDPLTGFPNSGSAAANAFVGGDVLRSCPGCSPAVYAPAWMLGLDLGGSNTDDLDALALRENGIAG